MCQAKSPGRLAMTARDPGKGKVAMCATEKAKAAPLSSLNDTRRTCQLQPVPIGQATSCKPNTTLLLSPPSQHPQAKSNTPSWKPSSLSHCQEANRADTGPGHTTMILQALPQHPVVARL